MNRQNFNISGGYPLETDTLEEMQGAYSLFNALGEIVGDKAIIKGCTADSEGDVSDGVVYVNGEVLKFRGGPKQTTVVIKQDAISKVFENGQQHEVLYERYLTFGSGPAVLRWDAFKRDEQFMKNLADLKARVNDKLAGKAPLRHNHDERYYTQNQADDSFEGEANGKKQVHWDRVVEKPTSYRPAVHDHNDRYYTKRQLDDSFEGQSEGKKQVHWDRLMAKPTSYPPSEHNHDDRYCLKSQIRNYASLTNIIYLYKEDYNSNINDFFVDRVLCSWLLPVGDNPGKAGYAKINLKN